MRLQIILSIATLLLTETTESFSFSQVVSSSFLQKNLVKSLHSTATEQDSGLSTKEIWGIEPDVSNFPGASFVLGMDNNDQQGRDVNQNGDNGGPPILEIPNFLSNDECEAIKEWALRAIDEGVEECDEYLNARVNKEVDEGGASKEGKALIDEFDLDDEVLSDTHKGGFRLRLDTDLIDSMLKDRILDLLGFTGKNGNRDFIYEEGLWVRPSPKTVCVRDQTVVLYGPGNGVPPHVDGKDSTLLVYLSDVPEGVGGRTVFPEDDFSQTPKKGSALLYRSLTELLHYSEAMTEGHDKWIMQILLDYNHDFKKGDLVTDYQTGTSYIWDGN